jgi:serine/threonine protein kinase
MERVEDRAVRPVAHIRLGRYELLKRIAVGGMAELFLARTTAQHFGYEKIVALKRILAAHAEDDQFITMFLAEARLAATLHHTNIVQLHDVGEEDGALFFTMEYVFGQDVRRIVRALQARQTGLPLEHALMIVANTAAGLHYAHQKEDHNGHPLGIVHRDVSPSNILVSYDGGIKLLDFGIARITAMQASTGQDVLKGKVPYMSPEQCRGEPLDRRSDVFSLGVVLWELTARRRLFVGDNELVIASRICGQDAPRPSEMLPGYPRDLEAIVMKALARERDRRYATAEELQVDLEEYAREHRKLLSSAKLAHFMVDLFAEEIYKAKADLRQRITSITGIFPAVQDEPPRRSTLPPAAVPSLLPASQAAAAATTSSEENPSTSVGIRESQSLGEHLLTRAEDLRARLQMGRGAGLGAVLLLAGALTLVFGALCEAPESEPLLLAAPVERAPSMLPLAYAPERVAAVGKATKKGRRGKGKGKRSR